MRLRGPAVAAVLLLVAGGVAAGTAPSEDELQAPIEVRGGIGERLVGRAAVITAESVQVARRLDFAGGGPDSTTPGVWVAVDVTVSCRTSPCSFGGSVLRTGGSTYGVAVLAPTPSFVRLNGAPGLRYRTTALFEVPAAALAEGRAELVAQEVGTPALDSVPVVVLPLPRAIAESVEVARPVLVGADR